MVQKVSVQIVDDIDGGEATQTVPFALDGVTYEIDLSDDNAGTLRDELERFIDASRRIGGRKVKVATGQSTVVSGTAKPTDRERNQQVRAWATANGYPIAERGRIPNDIYEAFDNAESAPVEPVAEEAPAKRKRAPRKKA
ncbi:Lsr2 family protein [Amycolatopsis sp. BJA-103]|uniref:histone-like nucleoid-structuring protein Lsr2 n=1 Tax=unclassified Amycolatopsis TaxID=2618356 RepID=UPI000C788221|nr:Lsr2 family protein [Amycolatopsis sp. BJA-103]AUI60262.1 nucleoid-associated protein Lsr2 [Amycolatopsis sp. BJA-103]PNE13116.1 nucleoid-associated protein Lsr2 [Amycolatopsis sp. BJA-103]